MSEIERNDPTTTPLSSPLSAESAGPAPTASAHVSDPASTLSSESAPAAPTASSESAPAEPTASSESAPAEPTASSESAPAAPTVSSESAPAEPTASAEPNSAAEEPTSTDAPAAESAEPAADSCLPPSTYRWSYGEEALNPASARPARRGVLTYALVMTAVFLVSFAMLIAVLWVGRYEPLGTLRPGVDASHDETAIDGVEQAMQSVVVIEVKTKTGGGTGTGIVMREDGYIATNHHVIDGATEIRVTFRDGTVMPAEIIGSSEIDDLAVIRVSGRGLIPAVFAYDKDAFVGQTVYAIGTPAGVEFAWTTTKGIISYKDREVKIYDETDGTLVKKLRLVQTDANVNPGNSGGPLVNTAGQVVGVVSMKLSEGYEGMGFAIPSDGAVEILDAIIEGRLDDIQSSVSHKRPMLGIRCRAVEAGKYYAANADGAGEIAASEVSTYQSAGYTILNPAVSGIIVLGVEDGMDAKDKLQYGDIITAVNAIETVTDAELMAVINEHYAGDTVTLTVYRGSIYTPVDITLSPKPAA